KNKMKKLTAMVLALVMVLALTAGAFAAGRLTKDEAKQIALKESGVTAAEATFTKAKLDYDDGREEYEFEFYADGKEFDVDVDANTGRVVKFDVERCYRDFDDRYERDFDDYYDFDDRYDYDDRYDHDFDDWYDFD
ncbi:MAG: PepSY domain-containing protein, partial [Oscillospiraceae bacterium]|nr:PepSY domain-containing protein [Oscillospiraceae bacterium]